MTIHCPNCRQAVLPDDTSCWHCGAALTPVPQPEDNQETAVQKQEQWLLQPAGMDALSPEVKPSPIIVYTCLTLGVIISMFVLLNRIDRPPLAQIPVSHILSPDWSVITLGDYEMTLELPNNWQAVEVNTAEQQAAFTSQIENAGYNGQLLLPFSRVYDDLTLRYYAYKGDQIAGDPFLMVVTSNQLNALSYEAVEATVESNLAELGYTIFQQEVIENANKTHYTLGIAIDGLRCQQQIISGRDTGVILAICAPANRFPSERGTIEDIYASFEYFPQGNDR